MLWYNTCLGNEVVGEGTDPASSYKCRTMEDLTSNCISGWEAREVAAVGDVQSLD